MLERFPLTADQVEGQVVVVLRARQVPSLPVGFDPALSFVQRECIQSAPTFPPERGCFSVVVMNIQAKQFMIVAMVILAAVVVAWHQTAPAFPMQPRPGVGGH